MSTTASPQECLEQFQACAHLVAEHLPESIPNKDGSVFHAASAHIRIINQRIAAYTPASAADIPAVLPYALAATAAATALMEAEEVTQRRNSKQLLRELRALALAAHMLLDAAADNANPK